MDWATLPCSVGSLVSAWSTSLIGPMQNDLPESEANLLDPMPCSLHFLPLEQPPSTNNSQKLSGILDTIVVQLCSDSRGKLKRKSASKAVHHLFSIEFHTSPSVIKPLALRFFANCTPPFPHTPPKGKNNPNPHHINFTCTSCACIDLAEHAEERPWPASMLSKYVIRAEIPHRLTFHVWSL